MCGIAGYKGIGDQKLLELFSKDLKHRGPDGAGFFSKDDVGLLNRRLAIIDRKGGDQPIFNEDKTIAVVYNGEIYNYRELRKDLEQKGHTFKTQSDTEIIVHLYEEKGEKCFEDFNGMFAAALYDQRKEKLVIARDQFGIKPLYFAFTGGNTQNSSFETQRTSVKPSLIFASEIKPLLHSKLIKTKPNEKILYRYLKYRIHDDLRETFFENVYRLLPGEVMTVDKRQITISRYTPYNWAISNSLKTNDYQKEFNDKLYEAIKLRLISEVPVGTSFSGGLDSSTVVAVVDKLLKDHVDESKSVGKIQKTFSAVFPGSTNDEEKYVDSVAEKINKTTLQVFKVKPNSDEFLTDILDFVKTQEEPTISTGPYAQYQVMRKAHKEVTVLLDGQGSDEMMAGYIPYYFVYFKQLLKEHKYHIVLTEVINSWDILLPLIKRKINSIIGKDKSIDPDTLMKSSFVTANKEQSFNIISANLKKRLYDDVFKNSLQSLLRYEDKNTMRFSIEGRVPFLDTNLIKFIFALPENFIIRNGWNKYILRNAVRDILPGLIVDRRNKIGFTTPEYQWFLEKADYIKSIFESKSFGCRSYFNQEEVLKKWNEFVNKKNTDTLLFWRLLNVELWLREFFD